MCERASERTSGCCSEWNWTCQSQRSEKLWRFENRLFSTGLRVCLETFSKVPSEMTEKGWIIFCVCLWCIVYFENAFFSCVLFVLHECWLCAIVSTFVCLFGKSKYMKRIGIWWNSSFVKSVVRNMLQLSQKKKKNGWNWPPAPSLSQCVKRLKWKHHVNSIELFSRLLLFSSS